MRNEEAELTRSRVAGWNEGRKEIVGHEEGSVNEFPEKRRGLEIPRGVIITSGQVDREVRHLLRLIAD